MPKTKLVLTKDIVIPAGTALDLAPVRSEYHTLHVDAIVGHGANSVSLWRMDLDEAKAQGLVEEQPDG